jgi:hypothetical protein
VRWVLGIAPKAFFGVKVDNHGYQKIKYPVLIYNQGYQINQILG